MFNKEIYVTTQEMERTPIDNLDRPYKIVLSKHEGWELFYGNGVIAGGKTNPKGLRVDIDGEVISDTLTPALVD